MQIRKEIPHSLAAFQCIHSFRNYLAGMNAIRQFRSDKPDDELVLKAEETIRKSIIRETDLITKR